MSLLKKLFYGFIVMLLDLMLLFIIEETSLHALDSRNAQSCRCSAECAAGSLVCTIISSSVSASDPAA